MVSIVTEVQVTKRAQELKVVDSEVVERRRVNKLKDLILDGMEPEEAERALDRIKERASGGKNKGGGPGDKVTAKGKRKRKGGGEGGRVRKKTGATS